MERSTSWFLDRLPSSTVLSRLIGKPVEQLLQQGRTDRGLVNFAVDVLNSPSADVVATTAALQLANEVAARLVMTGSIEPLSAEEKEALEVFVLLTSRPAIPVEGGQVRSQPLNWPEIGASHDWIKTAVLPAVGRLSRGDGAACGTGFVVAPDRLLTNNHVVWALVREHQDPIDEVGYTVWKAEPDLFQQRIDERNVRWRQSLSTAPSLDRRGERGSSVAERSLVRQVMATHAEADLAVLQLDRPLTVAPLPLTTSAMPPGRRVFLVGYPTTPPRGTAAAHLEQIFGTDEPRLGFKRLSPGQLGDLRSATELHHDASTLGGNSGSPVIDFQTRSVVAIHYGMLDTLHNLAVPLWLHRGDAELAFLAT